MNFFTQVMKCTHHKLLIGGIEKNHPLKAKSKGYLAIYNSKALFKDYNYNA